MNKEEMDFLIEVYKNAKYFVLRADKFYKSPENIDFLITVGQTAPQIDNLIESSDLNYPSWTYITAFNPYSEERSIKENRQRNQELLSEFLQHPDKIIIRYGFGVGSDYDSRKSVSEQPNLRWQPEESFIVIGISREEAMNFGKKYEQNAVLFGEKSGITELVVLKK